MTASSTLAPSRDSAQATSEALADMLRSKILAKYEPGARFPSMRQLMARTGHNYNTVNRAVSILAEEGLLEKRLGAGGTIVKDPEAPDKEARMELKRIGVVLPFWGSPEQYFVHQMLMGLAEQANTDRCRIELITHTGDEAAGYEFVDKVRDHHVDGLIWMQPVGQHAVNLGRLMERGVKIVLTGRRFFRLPLPVVHEDVPRVGELVADYMVRHHRERLLVLSGPLDDSWSADRIASVREALGGRGLELSDDNIVLAHNLPLDSNPQGERLLEEAVRRHLEGRRDFDAVFALHPNHLSALFRLHEAGLFKCPDDFKVLFMEVASHTPIRMTWPNVPIDLIRWPIANIGRMAVRRMEMEWGVSQEDTSDIDLLPWLDEDEAMAAKRT